MSPVARKQPGSFYCGFQFLPADCVRDHGKINCGKRIGISIAY
jgi:hypothetical protein